MPEEDWVGGTIPNRIPMGVGKGVEIVGEGLKEPQLQVARWFGPPIITTYQAVCLNMPHSVCVCACVHTHTHHCHNFRICVKMFGFKYTELQKL